jgi:hypothetical protein
VQTATNVALRPLVIPFYFWCFYFRTCHSTKVDLTHLLICIITNSKFFKHICLLSFVSLCTNTFLSHLPFSQSKRMCSRVCSSGASDTPVASFTFFNVKPGANPIFPGVHSDKSNCLHGPSKDASKRGAIAQAPQIRNYGIGGGKPNHLNQPLCAGINALNLCSAPDVWQKSACRCKLTNAGGMGEYCRSSTPVDHSRIASQSPLFF